MKNKDYYELLEKIADIVYSINSRGDIPQKSYYIGWLDYHAGKIGNSSVAQAWETACAIREKIYDDEVQDKIDDFIEDGLIPSDSTFNKSIN